MFLAWGVMVCLSHVLRVHETRGDTGPCRGCFFSITFKFRWWFFTYKCIFLFYMLCHFVHVRAKCE